MVSNMNACLDSAENEFGRFRCAEAVGDIVVPFGRPTIGPVYVEWVDKVGVVFVI